MNRVEATIRFREYYAEVIASNDKPAIRGAWNDYIDRLHRDGNITDYQVRTWIYTPLKGVKR